MKVVVSLSDMATIVRYLRDAASLYEAYRPKHIKSIDRARLLRRLAAKMADKIKVQTS